MNGLRKYIKSVLSEIQMKKILFHGTPYSFKEFKNRTTFFSDNAEFAWDYASTKSQDAEMDADISVVECELVGNIFDPYNNEDFMKLVNEMPDKVNVAHGTWSMFSHDYPKEEVLKRIKGIMTVQPVDYIANAKIGDEVGDPMYKSDLMMVVDKDQDFVYTIHKKEFQHYISSSSFGKDEHFSRYADYKDVFKEWRQAIMDLYNQKMERKTQFFQTAYRVYYYATILKQDYDTFVGKTFLVTDEEKKHIDDIYQKNKKTLEDILKKELPKDKWTIHPIEEPIKDTWTYFENDVVHNIIVKLGYDGYVAKEKGHNTYAIFNPQKSVRILQIAS